MLPSSIVVVLLRTMKGRKISEENKVLRNNTGITALLLSACFLNES
jgi:uncharacterized protein with ACT and thioredoxin-like domain